ncbi:hypothetical protein BDZ89DRAFT_1139009 [Hymenopellis radicata]|nr:hypothetical protein BDZ89DRAFT_1139009 [Hymenopellis radicata]
MSKSLIDHAVLMRSVLGEPVMEMDVPDRDEGQSVVQAKLSRHIRLKSPAPICDEEPLLTVHSDDEPPPARRRKRSIKSKATVESDDEEDNSVFVDKASSKTRSHRGARESIVDMEAVESEEELPKDPKGKGKASVKKDVVNRIQRSKASPDTRQKALAAIQAFGKEYPGFLSSSGAFNFAGDEPIDVKQEAKQGGSRFQSSSKRNVPVLETIVVSTDEDGPATKHGYQRDGFVVDSDEDHSDASNKRRNKKKVSHRETPQSEDLPEVADMFKALDQPAKERRKYLEDEYTRYEEDNEAEGAAERLAAQGRKPKSSANVDGPILQEYCEAGHPLHILYLKHPNAGLPMSTLTPTYRAHAKLNLWTFSFDHPALKRFDPKGFASFVAFLSFAHEDMFANIGNCDPDTFELLKYQTATGSTGHNLVFAEDNGTVVSLEVGLCVSSNLRTSVARTPTSKGHGFTYIPMDQSHNLLTAVLGVVFGFREKSVAFTTVEVDGTERLSMSSSTYPTANSTIEPNWKTLSYPGMSFAVGINLTKAGVSSPRSSPVKSTSMFASTPSTPSRSSPSKPVQPIAYPATQPFAAAIPIYDATGGIDPGMNLWKALKGNTLKVYKDGKQEVPADSLVVVGNCINTYTAQDDTVLSFNVQFVIILALPPSTSVPSTPQKSRESNTPSKKRKNRPSGDDEYVPASSSTRNTRSQKS